MRRRLGRDERGQLYVIESILVGVVVFVAIAMVSVGQLPTSPGSFEEGDLERLASDVLATILARPADAGTDPVARCNDPAPCVFGSELERLIAKALGYEGTTVVGETHSTVDIKDYFDQALPDGASYIVYFSNGKGSTTIHPFGLVPSGNVVTGSVLMTPNWVIGAAGRTSMVAMRVGELSGLPDPDGGSFDRLIDPLGRANKEVSPVLTWKSQFANVAGTARVPSSAVLGPHEFCSAPATCGRFFTVVPISGFGAGSAVLAEDRDFSSFLKLLGPVGENPLTTANQYRLTTGGQGIRITGGDGSLASGERLYLDLNSIGSNRVDAGDIRISPHSCTGCAGGTFVKAGDSDVNAALSYFGAGSAPPIKMRSAGTAGTLEEGEEIYLDVDGDSSVVATKDRRLSRVGVYGVGTEAAAGQFDVGRALDGSAFTGFRVRYADLDIDNTIDPGEPVYLDLVGNGQIDGIEPFDVHLTSLSIPPKRNAFEVRLVTWFGG